MAIAGLYNTPALDSSFLRDSQSQASRQVGNEGRVRTRASSLLQMWRGLEDESVSSPTHERVSERVLQQRNDGSIADLSETYATESHDRDHVGGSEIMSTSFDHDCETWSEGQSGSQIEDEDPRNPHDEHSCDFGEVERGRVRQIFREWMNTGARECTTPNGSHLSNGCTEWLGETEQERVRIIRERAQKSSQQRDANIDSREDQGAEISVQIERVRDGVIINQSEGRSEHARRGIRRLCGRQALLDMLKKAEMERHREIQGLLEQQAVSRFPHRNRIQSLLKSWFLRNGRLIGNERPASVADSELGLLRERHTVSGLREGFYSRLDNSVCNETSINHNDSTSNIVFTGSITEHHQVNSFEDQGDLHEHMILTDVESGNQDSYLSGLSNVTNDSDSNNVETWQDLSPEIEGWQEQVSSPNELRDWQLPECVEHSESTDCVGQNVDRILQETTANYMYQESLQVEAGEHSNMQVAEESLEQFEPSNEEPGFSISEGNEFQDINMQESTAQVEQSQQQVLGNESNDWQQSGVEHNIWSERFGADMDESQLESTSNDWSQELLETDNIENVHLQNVTEDWHEHGGYEEALPNWLAGSSNQEAVPVGRLGTHYFPDNDNNAYSSEIRELQSRRRVSNLLSSGFRESLDQLIQSYVERQGQTTNDWELDVASLGPPSTDQNLVGANGGQNGGQGNTVGSTLLALHSPPTPPPEPFWYQEIRNDGWSQHGMHQRLGTEWEIINYLRIDMVRLQQRMSSLQRMLEACMDMQLELQRSIRQEVSAALNRPAGSEAESEDRLPYDVTKWDHVRKGICCVCCKHNIDSLLYRCGHMCACSKCADELVEIRGKCPMCRAPVIEVIRAYSA